MILRDPQDAASNAALSERINRVLGLPREPLPEQPPSRALVPRPRGAGGLVRHGAPASLPALREAELALMANPRPVARRRTKVPSEAFVALAKPLLPAPEPHLRLAPPQAAATANDNVSPVPTTRRWKAIAREVVLAAAFAAALAGMYYVGRVTGFQNVIVVPEPWDRTTKLSCALVC